jgi:hypothetical protein
MHSFRARDRLRMLRCLLALSSLAAPLASPCIASFASSSVVLLTRRVVLSDGALYIQGILTTDLNNLVLTEAIQPGSIIRLDQYMCNDLSMQKSVDAPTTREATCGECI